MGQIAQLGVVQNERMVASLQDAFLVREVVPGLEPRAVEVATLQVAGSAHLGRSLQDSPSQRPGPQVRTEVRASKQQRTVLGRSPGSSLSNEGQVARQRRMRIQLEPFPAFGGTGVFSWTSSGADPGKGSCRGSSCPKRRLPTSPALAGAPHPTGAPSRRSRTSPRNSPGGRGGTRS